MQFFYVLVFFVNGEMDHGIVTKSEWECSELMSIHMSYPEDMICMNTGQASSSLRPKLRLTSHIFSASEQSDHLAHDSRH